MSSLEEIRLERLRKIELLKESGMDPYPAESRRDRTIAEFLGSFQEIERTGGKVTLAGRILSLRGHGALVFADIFDGTERTQLILKRDEVGEEAAALWQKAVDESDFIEAAGTALTSKTGQKSLLVQSWRMLAKSIRPVPDEWFGLTDEDERYRRRYIDILLRPEAREMIRRRSQFWNVIREHLLSRDFVEVETPVLENMTGGAEARPFITHHNALDIDVYLRISAGELWQKKLLVAGLPKVFEIGRIFRNEGMSHEHAQDYTQLEYYAAFMDYRDGMEMTKDLYRTVASKVFGKTAFSIKGMEVDLNKEWPLIDFCEAIRTEYGLDPLKATLKEVEARLKEHRVEFDPKTTNLERGVDLLWKRLRKSIPGPAFLVGVPVYLEPLAKRSRGDDRTVERFQVILAGSEVGKGFSELNDPVDQRKRFEHQQALRDQGDEEAQMADFEFVEALEYGMPPAFGFGVSERLFSFLQDISLREGQTFPLMRPKESPKPAKRPAKGKK